MGTWSLLLPSYIPNMYDRKMLLQRWVAIPFPDDPHKACVSSDCGEKDTVSFRTEVWRLLDQTEKIS